MKQRFTKSLDLEAEIRSGIRRLLEAECWEEKQPRRTFKLIEGYEANDGRRCFVYECGTCYSVMFKFYRKKMVNPELRGESV